LAQPETQRGGGSRFLEVLRRIGGGGGAIDDMEDDFVHVEAPADDEAMVDGSTVAAETLPPRPGRVMTSYSLVHLLRAQCNWDAPLVEILGEGGMAALLALKPGGNTYRVF
jgi:hypothetical protein